MWPHDYVLVNARRPGGRLRSPPALPPPPPPPPFLAPSLLRAGTEVAAGSWTRAARSQVSGQARRGRQEGCGQVRGVAPPAPPRPGPSPAGAVPHPAPLTALGRRWTPAVSGRRAGRAPEPEQGSRWRAWAARPRDCLARSPRAEASPAPSRLLFWSEEAGTSDRESGTRTGGDRALDSRGLRVAAIAILLTLDSKRTFYLGLLICLMTPIIKAKSSQDSFLETIEKFQEAQSTAFSPETAWSMPLTDHTAVENCAGESGRL
ncbi:translation initiation factor IF-2-like [Elephas maximus indicus]|uniref:translation initiation factor IF-2-like n=1 Tax=Elephas maximus indicus TaxID=99487 RepID=UPI002115D943|nr:translation initiation factor IF-2-like [Elephas maximus indicus]